VPAAPKEFNFLTAAKRDLFDIADGDAQAGQRIREKIEELQRQTIQWGRVPQDHLQYLTDSPSEYNFYRQKIGNSGFRVVYHIDSGEMIVVAVLPRTDRTYQLDTFVNRVDAYQED
jgi:mRNA interferase RelE/StbE